MAYEFRDQIRCPGIAHLRGIENSGRQQIRVTTVQNNSETLNAGDPFVYNLQDDDYFLSVTENANRTVYIILPLASAYPGRLFYYWDGGKNGMMHPISVRDSDDLVNSTEVSKISDNNGTWRLLISSGEKWYQFDTGTSQEEVSP